MARFEGKEVKDYDNKTLDYVESNRTYVNRIDGSFNIFQEVANDLKTKMDAGCALFTCRSWDKDKQEGVFQALYITENENQPRVFEGVRNGTNIKYDLQGGEVCLLANVFGDLDSQFNLEPMYCPVWQGVGNFLLISVLSDCFFEVKKKDVSFAFTEDGLIIKGGSIKVEGGDIETDGKISADSDIKAGGNIASDSDIEASGDVKVGTITLTGHGHKCPPGTAGGPSGPAEVLKPPTS